MSLHPSAEQKVRDWLQERCPSLRCPFCGSTELSIGDLTVSFRIPEHYPGPIDEIGISSGEPQPAHMTVPLTCDACAYTLSFNASKMGLLDSD